MVKNRCSIALLLNYINVCLTLYETKHTQVIGNNAPCLMDKQMEISIKEKKNSA